jgi:hypothetical protein
MQFSSYQELTTMDQPGQTRRLPSEQVRVLHFLSVILTFRSSKYFISSLSCVLWSSGGSPWFTFCSTTSCFLTLSLSFLFHLGGPCLCFGLQELQPNQILLITIHNLLYPITVDVLHQVFSPHGFVEKIVTFQKSSGQLSFRFCAALCLSFSLLSLGPFWDIIDCFD